MLMIDNQVITLVVLILCIIICFKTSSTVLCTIIGSVLVSCLYKNGQNNRIESIINFPSLIKQQPKTNKLKVTELVKQKDKFYINNDGITLLDQQDIENELETDMEIELNKNKNKNVDNTIKIEENNIEKFITKEDVPNICLNDNIIDGDERIAYNSIHRNEPTRVIIGMGKAYQNLGRYVREEVEEVEGKEWWGNNEY